MFVDPKPDDGRVTWCTVCSAWLVYGGLLVLFIVISELIQRLA